MSLICCSCKEREKALSRHARHTHLCGWADGLFGRVAWGADGLVRSSDEAAVMVVERRDRLICGHLVKSQPM